MDETGVSAGLVGAVVEDANPRQPVPVRLWWRGPLKQAPFGQFCRRIKTPTGQQHGAAEEGMQRSEVVGPPVGQIAVGFSSDPDGYGGMAHQLRVRGLLSAQHHNGDAMG